MNGQFLDFERPVIELERKIKDMKDFAKDKNVEIAQEVEALEKTLKKLQKDVYSNLSPWQRVQLARHPQRPHSLDYINLMTTDFVELHGDRAFADDKAVVGGFAKLDGEPVVIIGQEKGKDTKQKLFRNFGMMHPEGYRKALRLMLLSAKFDKAIIILIDTPGAYPGIGAEERGQAEAIAKNLKEMSRIPVPIIINIVGEGASGGALGIGVGDKIFMLENSWYSVISPEGCAAILWRDVSKSPQAAEALKLTAPHLLEIGVIDKIIPEPLGGAHRDYLKQAQILKEEILFALEELKGLSKEQLLEKRIEKFRKMGQFIEEI